MSADTNRRRLGRFAVAGATVLAAAVAVPAVAGAATTNAVTNGSFDQPGTEGAVPTSWTPTDLGVETAPYKTTAIGTYDAAATKYAPPTGTPGGDMAGNFATEAYYSAGSSTGVEGFGGSQTLASPVASSTDPQVSWATVQTYAPSPSVSGWAGSLLEVDFTSGGSSYQLRYINPFTPTSGTYASSPVTSDTATTKYVVLAPLTSKTWYQQPAEDVPTDVASQFGLTSFTITGVIFGDLEDTTSAASPYPNETSYWKNVSLASGSPVVAAPEAPLAVVLPLGAVAVLGAGAALRRRRRRV